LPDLVLPVTEKQWKEAGSKFITFPPDAQIGDVEFRSIELGMPDWDTPDVSIKFPVVVTQEGIDKDKRDKISCGVGTTAVWKLKGILGNLGVPYKMVGNKVAFDTDLVTGKAAVGVWTFQEGTKGGVPGGEKTKYPKLTDILSEGSRPQTETIL